jgi:hypothetical protein
MGALRHCRGGGAHGRLTIHRPTEAPSIPAASGCSSGRPSTPAARRRDFTDANALPLEEDRRGEGSPSGRNSYHRSCACVEPSNGRHTRRGRLLVDPVCRCLARRRSNPSLQNAYCENDRRRHCTRPRWRASHHCYSLGSFRLTISYMRHSRMRHSRMVHPISRSPTD